MEGSEIKGDRRKNETGFSSLVAFFDVRVSVDMVVKRGSWIS